jgi:methionyl-tRNA formyltransferase
MLHLTSSIATLLVTMKLIFMGTPEFAVASLKRLIEAGHEIRAVFTQPDKPVGRKQIVTPPPVKVFAQERGIEVFQPAKIKTAETQEQFEPMFRDVDAGVVAAYGRILPQWMLDAPHYGCINVHSSLLPKYRGAAPINWAIACGERETGVTIMQMDAGMDTGPMLMQRAIPIGDEETAAELLTRLAELGAQLMVETLSGLERGEIVPMPQDEDKATLAPMLKREDGQVDWTMTAVEIFNRLRGFTPFPGCYTFLGGKRLEIVKARVEAEGPDSALPAGSVSEITRDSLVVTCGGGTRLRITEVQPEGKRPMAARDFLNGAKLSIGSKLGS